MLLEIFFSIRTCNIPWDCFWIVLRRFLLVDQIKSHLETISWINPEETNLCIQTFARHPIFWHCLVRSMPLTYLRGRNSIFALACCVFVWLFCTALTGVFLHMQAVWPGRSHIFEEEVECNFLLPCKSAITYHFVNKSNKILHTFIQIFLYTFLQIFVHTIFYTFYIFTFYKQVVLQFVLHFNKFSHASMHICNHSQFCITTSVSL